MGRTATAGILAGAALAAGVAQGSSYPTTDGRNEPASSITQTSATLNATVNPNGAEVSNAVEYGTTTYYKSSARRLLAAAWVRRTPVAVSASSPA